MQLEHLAVLLAPVDAGYAETVRSRVAILQQRARGRSASSGAVRDYASALCVYEGADDIESRVAQLRDDLDARLEAGRRGISGEEQDNGVCRCLHDLANLRRATRDFDDARRLFEDAVAKSASGSNPRRAALLTDFAALLQDTGDYDRAVPLYARALSAVEDDFGVDDGRTATCCANLGQVYAAVGDARRSEAMYALSLIHI